MTPTRLPSVPRCICGPTCPPYEGEPEQIGEDVMAFLGELEDEGLVRVLDDQPA
jgi:hypothetical protein